MRKRPGRLKKGKTIYDSRKIFMIYESDIRFTNERKDIPFRGKRGAMELRETIYEIDLLNLSDQENTIFLV